jgi:FKBP-type peptidyl-prolyl cis-trans isomerase FkpA
MRKLLPLLALTSVLSCNDEVTGLEPPSDPTTEVFHPSVGVDIATMTKTESGAWFKDVTAGTGLPDTATTDSIKINYVGRLKDGTQFEASNNVTFEVSRLVTGMKQGVYGMKEGGKRKIVIPSALGYGAQAIRDTNGAIKIPRQSTLIFDVDLVKAFNHVDSTTTATLRKP